MQTLKGTVNVGKVLSKCLSKNEEHTPGKMCERCGGKAPHSDMFRVRGEHVCGKCFQKLTQDNKVYAGTVK